ncbi:hypothetical protein BCR35DRAFT_196404 [Leucosporidium creatinivorum]|uniref:N-acetylglucosaminylphosphatidylinositol deacetylase n=1 Tax=Leucosporidium creatinivorum TaxID=106004 RepID=A0A1Y2DPC8_9BASI|nr:hypothetical protein BCR35DRAFT_196404 [Leucosporidium creatinivorum]
MVSSSRSPASGFSLATLLVAFACQLSLVSAAVFTCTGGTVYVVAHADDDLLFQSPDLLTDMQTSTCVTTVFLSAGESGTTGDTYYRARESGNEAATAQMAGVDDSYSEFSAIFGGQPTVVRTLVGAPQVQKLYFRLPDGAVDGTGFAVNNYQTLRALYFGSISTITNNPGTSTYTLATLKQAIAEILTARQPDNVRTLDYLSDYDGGDHSDHLTTARLVKSLVGTYAPNAGVAGYMGYPVQNFAPTMDTGSSSFLGKTAAFFSYTPFDSGECQSYEECMNNGRGEAWWLTRQYVVTPELAEASYIGSAQTPVTLPNSTNIARIATCSASSQSSVQPATAAIDGVIGGYPGNYAVEWSSYAETVGATYTLTWTDPYTVTDIALYDRPNQYDWIKGGKLTFADGSSVTFGALANDGSATLVSLLSPVITNSIQLTVTAASASSANVGLSEFQVYGAICSGCAFNSTTAASTLTSAGLVSGNGAFSDLALQATATASSYSTGQGPEKVNNGLIGGYTDDDPSNYMNEWASNGELVGAWINLTWPAYYMVDSLIFYDRPNDGDWVTGGHVDFDDGSSVNVPALNDDGSATIVNLTTPVNISSLLFTVTSVGPWSNSIGLSELSVSYSQAQTPVNFTAPLYVATNTTITTSNSTTAIPTIDTTSDLALNATATASSSSSGQGPEKAIDGNINGYKENGSGDYTTEWASNGEKAGAWLNLTWPAPIAVTQVVLYDRPNLSDRVLGGTLTWSDGTSRTFGALNADGSATTINLSKQVNTTSLLVTITSVSLTTNSVGLAEVTVFGPGNLVNNVTSTFTNSTSTANATLSSAISNATATASLNATATAFLNITASLNATATSLFNATASATGLSKSTLSLNSTITATSKISSATSKVSSSSTNESSVKQSSTSTSKISSSTSILANATRSANATLPVATGLNGTATLSANVTLPTLSVNISSKASSTLSANVTLPTLSSTNLTGIPASGSGYSTILGGNTTSSGASSSATPSVNATSSAVSSSVNATSSAIPTASVNGTSSSLASSAAKSASASASSVSSVVSSIASVNASSASSASSSASKASSSSISASLSAASSASSAASSAASSNASAASASAASVSSASVASASSASVAAASQASVSAAGASSAAKASASSVSAAAQASASSASAAAIASASSASAAAVASASSASVAAASSASAAKAASTSSMVVTTRSSTSTSASSTVASATSTGLPTAAAQATGVNIALFGTATASSFRTSSPPKGVNDGEVDGLSILGLGDASQEWSTGNKNLPAWVQLNFTSNYLAKTIYLFAPVNTLNTITGGTLSFSDGTSIDVTSVSSSGTAVSLGTAGKTFSSVRFTITKMGMLASAAGLSEIKIFNAPTKVCGLLQPNCLVSL